MLPVFPSDTRVQIEEIINQIGREVTFYLVETLSGCYSCNLDPFTNTSMDSYCEVCSGQYWIPTYSGWSTTAHVLWGHSEDNDWHTGGIVENGDCMVKFMHSQEAEQVVFSSAYVEVDGRTLNVSKINLRGVPEINRILVTLIEREN